MEETLTNEKMVAGRYLRWATARKKVADIKAHLAAGGLVMIVTALKATVYESKHAEWFEAARNGAFVRSGKSRVCIDYVHIRFGRKKETK